LNFKTGKFYWWVGVVEDRNDPMMLGRVRVRIFGIHTKQKVGGIETHQLPWAYPMQPITSAAMNGIGDSPVGVVEGTHVVGFFRDGANQQDPIIMGSIGGIPQKEAEVDGFNDPNRKYPKKDHINEPDTNRLARGYDKNVSSKSAMWEGKDGKTAETKMKDTYIPQKLADRDVDVNRAYGALPQHTWSEPQVPFAANYPYNHVRESESGHIEEWDDTPGRERLHKRHRSGTFEEIHPDGKKVTKVVSDNYSIVLGSEYIHIKDTKSGDGNLNITVDGVAHILVKDSVYLEVEGDLNERIHGNWNLEVMGNVDWTFGSVTNPDSGSWTIKQTGNLISTIQGKSHNEIAKTFHQKSGLDTTIIGGPNIHLNP